MVNMETGKELTGTDGQPYQQARDDPLAVHFMAIDGIASQEIDLIMASFEEIVAEMQRLENGTIQGADTDHRIYPTLQGDEPC